MTSSYKGMTVNTGTTQAVAIIEVHQFEKRSMVFQAPLDILIGTVAGGVDVAGVDADTEPLILERLHKVQELIVVC